MCVGYAKYMFQGVRIFSSDAIWRQILTDLGAVVLDAPNAVDLNFDELDIPAHVSLMQLKSIILGALDDTQTIYKLFGRHVQMPRMQMNIVAHLYKTGGLTMAELKEAMGFAPDVATHTLDTAIYQLRKTHGRDFIINENGVYKIGSV